MIKTITKNPEAFTLKNLLEMEELTIDIAKVGILRIWQIFF